jgi:cytidine deaminase
VQAVVVCAESLSVVTPCGGCRQKLREFAAADCPVWAVDMQQVQGQFTLGELLPHSFGPGHLRV